MSVPMSSNIVRLVKTTDCVGYIFGANNKYVVPEYQREYSWGEDQIEAFMASVERCMDGEDVFMGTIQHAIDGKQNNEHHIIDGQQRLTTLILFCRILELLSAKDILSKNEMKLHILNFPKNGEAFNDSILLSIDDLPVVGKSKKARKQLLETEDRYVQNLRLINSYAKEILETRKCTAEELYDAVMEKLYFVALVTTDVPLPQVVSIFNTINTTGLDLNSADLFKLQFYEYLKKHYPDKDSWMKEISACYERVSEAQVDMRWILDVYKHCIVAKFDLKWDMLSKSNEKFFDEIFFGKESSVRGKVDHPEEILSFDHFKRLIDVFIEFRGQMNTPDSALAQMTEKESLLAVEFIEMTRYSRYWTLPYIAAFFSCDVQGLLEQRIESYLKCLDTALEVSKYFIVCSVTFDKVINPVQTFMCGTILPLATDIDAVTSYKKISEEIQKKIKKSPYDPNYKNDKTWGDVNAENFENRIRRNLFENWRRAKIVCTLSGVLEEIENGTSIHNIKQRFFDWSNYKYDMEHIYARAIFMKKDSENAEVYNSVGNLVVLEHEINRSIKDAEVAEKLKKYEKSNFHSVQRVMDTIRKNDAETWDFDQVEKRSNEQVDLLSNYLNLRQATQSQEKQAL